MSGTRWDASGFLRFGRWRGAPILWHWTLPVGLYLLSGMRFAPVRWAAMTFLVLLHELGHAFFVRRYGARVRWIKVMPIGGLCAWDGDVREVERSIIAWGGVLAQGCVWLVTTVALVAAPPLPRAWMHEVAAVWTSSNAFLIALNLMPVQPLDGYDAWRLPLRAIQSALQRVENEKVRRQVASQRRAGALADATPQTTVRAQPAEDVAVTEEARALADAMWKDAREKQEE